MVLLIFLLPSAVAAEIASVRFAVPHDLPTFPETPAWNAIRPVGLTLHATLPERAVLIAAARMAAPVVGIADDELRNLEKHIRTAYTQIDADPALARLPSALDDAFSRDARRQAHYFLARPDRTGPDTPVIVFLHGLGGNFHFYTALLHRHFPNAIIIAPSYGLAWTPAGEAHLQSVLTHAGAQVGHALDRPSLIALSAGGRAGLSIYLNAPERYRRAILLATRPLPELLRRLDATHDVHLLLGRRDPLTPPAEIDPIIAEAQRKAANLTLQWIDSGHFFLLTDQDQCWPIIRQMIER